MQFNAFPDKDNICPYKTLLAYIKRAHAGKVDKKGQKQISGPLFLGTHGEPISNDTLTHWSSLHQRGSGIKCC